MDFGFGVAVRTYSGKPGPIKINMATQAFDLGMPSIKGKGIGVIKILHPVRPIKAIQTCSPAFPQVGFDKWSIILGVAVDAG